jgi:hypothetical protein
LSAHYGFERFTANNAKMILFFVFAPPVSGRFNNRHQFCAVFCGLNAKYKTVTQTIVITREVVAAIIFAPLNL